MSRNDVAGGYNPDDYEELPVSQELQDVFQYILQYKPEIPQLETPLKPFIPDFIPAIGDIDEFIKVYGAPQLSAAEVPELVRLLLAYSVQQ